jgi:hypothetical protein
MNRRSFLSSLSAVALTSSVALGSARADMVYEPPPRLEVQAASSTYTSPPQSVTLTVTNPTTEAIELQGPRLIVLTGGVRVPLHVTRVELDGVRRGIWDPFTIPARGSVRLTIAFDEVPASSLAAGRIDFALSLQGASESTFSMRRG